jgi:NTP pyrophosphatase (non-canonical NTP hydrolase)
MSYKIQYLTAKLQEEAAEVIQAVSKINRFGPHNSHPDRTTTNLQELVGELEDFLAIVAALEHYKYIDLTLSQQQIANKAKALIQG